MAWSKYQNEIFEYAINPGNGSFVVQAVAGSGKTTTAVECAKRIAASNPNYSILFLAFNKSIVEKLKTETQGLNMTCKTLHGFGAGVLYKSGIKFCLNENKWKNFINNNYLKYLKETIPDKKIWIYKKNCENLLNMCRINLIKGGADKAVSEIAERYNIQCISNEVEAVSKMLKKTNELIPFKTKNGYEIDWVDMLCMPQTDAFRKYIMKYDIVFIDEAQDLNKAQQQLMLLTVNKGGKFIGVGDMNQSITGFAGALTNSFEQLENIAGKSLPLSVNYRCGKNIIAEAQKIVPEITAYENAIDGEIIHTDNLKCADKGDMIICRKTAPLISIALKMMSVGKSAYIKGKDIAEDMKFLIEKVYSEGDDNGIGMNTLYSKLDNLLDKTKEDLIEKGAYRPDTHPVFAAMLDKVESIKILGSHCQGVGDVLELLNKIFDDTVKGDAVMCSTVHKAKGLESDNVFIICPELLPMRYENQQEWELKQEMNLKYVAITRAKQKLVWVDVCEALIKDIAVI